MTRLHRNSDNVFDLYVDEVSKGGDYTVQAGDNGKLFTNGDCTAAMTFTLPSLGVGYLFGFLVTANQNVTIACAEGDKIVTFNDAAADSLAFSTSSEKLGGYVELFTNAAGTKWYVKKLCSNTITVAT